MLHTIALGLVCTEVCHIGTLALSGKDVSEIGNASLVREARELVNDAMEPFGSARTGSDAPASRRFLLRYAATKGLDHVQFAQLLSSTLAVMECWVRGEVILLEKSRIDATVDFFRKLSEKCQTEILAAREAPDDD